MERKDAEWLYEEIRYRIERDIPKELIINDMIFWGLFYRDLDKLNKDDIK